MGVAKRPIERLLPRHASRTGVMLDWHIVTTKRGLRRREHEEFGTAKLVDISLEGALVEVDDTFDHQTGDRVRIRFQGISATVEIRNRRPCERECVLYGIRFQGDTAFRDAVNEAVGDLRGRHSELAEAWNRTS